MAHERRSVRRALQVLPLVHHVRARAFLVRLFGCLLRTAEQPEVAKFVAARDRFVVDHGRARREARDDVVDKGDEEVVLVLVHDVHHAFLHVRDDDARALRLQADDHVGHDLCLAFAQELLHAEVVDSEIRADAGEETALEREEGERRLFDLGLVDEFEIFAFVLETVDMDKAGGARTRVYNHVFACADDEEGLVILGREGNCRNANGGFVFVEVDLLKAGFCGDGVDNVDARRPVALAPWIAKFCWRKICDISVDQGSVGQ